jgi:hypothetical protein
LDGGEREKKKRKKSILYGWDFLLSTCAGVGFGFGVFWNFPDIAWWNYNKGCEKGKNSSRPIGNA